jgi:hypothetical protein
MRTYDAATYSDLTKNTTVYMIHPMMMTADTIGVNTSSFQVVLDGTTYPARVDEEGRVHVIVHGDDTILYTTIASGGNRTSRNRYTRTKHHTRKMVPNHTRNMAPDRSRHRNYNPTKNSRNSNNGI